jgi:hypothetical protein
MSVQNRGDNSNIPFISSGVSLVKEAETILQDAARVNPLVKKTVMAQIAASKKWVPLTDLAATDGSAIARGVYMGDDIPAADLVAGDVVDVPILVGGGAATLVREDIVLENALTLDDVLQAATINEHRVEDDLNRIGLFPEYTVSIDELEN